jgi:beta-lactamase regulating signal transducer with metallopeptidase domain
MIPIQFQAIANHLWQSTLFAAAAGLLVVAFRRYGPQVRYGLWLAASAKFLVPFSILSTAGNWFGRRAEVPIAPPISFAIQQVNEPFTVDFLPSPVSANPATHPIEWSTAIWGIWAFGSLCIVIRWVRGMRQIRIALREASPLEPVAEGPVMLSAAILEPSIVGVFRPVLLIPEGIDVHLTPLQLKSVVLHEIGHVHRRDNLTGLIHSAVEVLFWFYPLVWWMGARLSDERERACDEEVLRSGIDAEAYAEGILRVCELYLKSPLPFVTGVTGSSLKKRIETIMIRRPALPLNFARKVVLAVAGFVALASPFVIGIVSVPILNAQQTTPRVVPPVWTPASGAPKDLLTAHEGERHDRFIDRARAGNLDIVFFGQTDTEMWLWSDRGRSVWDQTF